MKVFLVILLLSQASLASTKLFFKKGIVKVNNSEVSKGKVLKDGDLVEVGKKSLAIIKFDKKAVVKLDQNSKLVIKKIHPGKKPTSLVLEAGSIFSKVLQKAAKGKTNFRVKARSAVMGVRGTEFFTAYSQDESKKNDVWMCVNEGVVEITSDGKKTNVKEGEGVFIKNGKSATAPKKYAWTKKLNWNLNPEKGDLENKAMNDLYQDLLDQDYD